MSTQFDVLASRIDALSCQVRAQTGEIADMCAALVAVADRVAEVEELATATAESVTEQVSQSGDGGRCPLASWLTEPAPKALAALTAWIDTVLVQYPDVVDALGECWPLHPWIVEELTALHAAWTEAYTGEHPSGIRAVDWHERHRPGVIERIRRALTDCSVHAHNPGGRADHTRLPEVPGLDQARTAVAWWTSQRPAETSDVRDGAANARHGSDTGGGR